ncbi:Sec-C motif domain protein [Flammeovirga pectinis]|uniref:Sec-C motif domain protein n=1 Tax=Flammeovirga pectinis TaxID=2494373 RepID=A0A3Q9FUU2_9BACT|nr:YchJ family metal-binding protein [Flammeovirga pectinis]AZQ64916.1 Sec-C motif domain protein [Flammeovirga pectinis]
MKELNECPCRSGKTYIECCGVAHKDIMKVKTAEQLMRSRYTAFTMANGNYLHKSHYSKTRPTSKAERRDTERWAKAVQWIKLDILNVIDGKEEDATGVVEFKAYYLDKHLPGIIHEKSTFRKENGHWVYDAAI